MRALNLNLATFLYPFVLTNITLGFFDLADLLVFIIFCMVIFANNFSLKLNALEYDYLKIICIFPMFSILITLTTDSNFLGEILRSIRYVLYFYITATLIRHNKDLLIKGIIFVILIHGLFALIGAFNEGFFNYFSNLNQYDKRWYVGRGNGLATSFDTAGFMLIAGIIILSLNKSLRNLLLASFLIICGFFTGRSFMYAAPVIFFIFFFFQWKSGMKYIAVIPLLAFFTITALLLGIDFFQFLIAFEDITTGDGYYDTYGQLTFWIGNYSEYSSLLGTGFYSDTDIGYLKSWSFGGFIYMVFQVLVFLLLPFVYSKRHDFLTLLALTVLVLSYNLKIYVFFSTIFAPLYLLIFMLPSRTNKI